MTKNEKCVDERDKTEEMERGIERHKVRMKMAGADRKQRQIKGK